MKNLQNLKRSKQEGQSALQELAYEAQLSYGSHKRSCPTKSEFTALKEAVDISDDIVQLAPLYQDDGTVVKQLVQESFCVKENCTCRGIKSSIFESTCMTNDMLRSTKVIKNGHVSWSYIKIRSGCSFVVKHKRQQNRHHTRNIVDIL